MAKNLLTSDCYNKLKIDYKYLLSEKKKLINELKLTKENGDLSENSEYKSTKRKQDIINLKLKEINEIINNHKIVKNNNNNENKISIFNKIKLLNINKNELKVYKIVNNEIANIKLGLISIDSNLGKSLIGKSTNEIIIIKKLNYIIKFKIIEII